MLALIQRVSSAEVEVENQTIARINTGLLVFLGIEKPDTEMEADKLIKKLLAYRVFSDSEDKMNLSVSDINADLLLVSQFTLAANTNSGLRPSFSSAKPPVEAEILYDYFVDSLRTQYANQQTEAQDTKAFLSSANESGSGIVECGRFGADMQVSLVNDGPVTFLLKS